MSSVWKPSEKTHGSHRPGSRPLAGAGSWQTGPAGCLGGVAGLGTPSSLCVCPETPARLSWGPSGVFRLELVATGGREPGCAGGAGFLQAREVPFSSRACSWTACRQWTVHSLPFPFSSHRPLNTHGQFYFTTCRGVDWSLQNPPQGHCAHLSSGPRGWPPPGGSVLSHLSPDGSQPRGRSGWGSLTHPVLLL